MALVVWIGFIEFVWARRWRFRVRLGIDQAKHAVGLKSRTDAPKGDADGPTQRLESPTT